MRKVISFLMVVTFLLLPISPAFAQVGLLNPAPKETCVVIVGDASVKTPDFFKYVDEAFNTEEKKKKVVSGTEIQSLYQTYWLDKGFLEEQKLTKQDLNDFVKYSGYKKVLYLIVSSPVVEKTKEGYGGWDGWVQTERTRASITIKTFLVNETDIIKAVDVTKEDDSVTSELRAKRGAFEKCIKEIKSAIGSYL